MSGLSKKQIEWVKVDENRVNQRVDNFLSRLLVDIPKSHIYKIIRRGEIRVNGKRIVANYKLQLGDVLRIPPLIRTNSKKSTPKYSVFIPTIYEDSELLIVDKPAGLAVHSGTGISAGLIEILRSVRKELKYLELIHRLDRGTSGVLLLAKNRKSLISLHEQFRGREIRKIYTLLVHGSWIKKIQSVSLKLQTSYRMNGERHVIVSDSGTETQTELRLTKRYGNYSLIEAVPDTGKTHQIRVHVAHLGFPIVGDDRYGRDIQDKQKKENPPKRMFLHAKKLSFLHPISRQNLTIEANIPEDFQLFIEQMHEGGSNL